MRRQTKTLLELIKININGENSDLMVFMQLSHIIEGNMRKSDIRYRVAWEVEYGLRVNCKVENQ